MLVEVRRRMPAIENRVALMRAALSSLKAFDYVVIDTGPSIDDLLVTILHATDYIIVPVEMDEHAVEGAARVSRKVAEIAGASGKPRILGYVANKYVERRLGDRNVIEALNKLFDTAVYETIIPSSIDIRYSQAARTDIYRYSPSSQGSVAMALVVEETLKRMGVSSGAAAVKKAVAG
jgi:chromosome partitioning protein